MCVLVAQCVAGLDVSCVLVAKKERCSIEAMCVDCAYFVDAPKAEKCLSALKCSSHKANSGVCGSHINT